ncbi:MAG: sigma-70 family RNA polymerase sigma factor [Pirellulaceae bacterium]
MSRSTNQLVEHFFRHESANLIAVLTRAFGIRRIDLIEDMVQVAMLEAMNAWKQRGVPDNPAAWIHAATKNRIIDSIRREQTYEKAITLASQSVDQHESTLHQSVDQWLDESQLPDSLLRMMFVCCHPTLDRMTQIALTLKTLCGFGIGEISRGLLMPAETVKKRITRAKQSLAAANVSLELPAGTERSRRIETVHMVLYLMFNEGYSTSHGALPIRDDICEEAVRLCHLVCESDCATPASRALLSLQLFHAARLESRVDADGEVILLEDQDRAKWNRDLICMGQYWMAQSKTDQPTVFHLESAIAMQHCLADSVAATDWQLIVRFYDRLLQLHDSPIYALNRAIAIGEKGDRNSALSILQSLRESQTMQNYPLLECAIARLHQLDGNIQSAIDAYLAALSNTTAAHEKRLLEKKLSKLTQQRSGIVATGDPEREF